MLIISLLLSVVFILLWLNPQLWLGTVMVITRGHWLLKLLSLKPMASFLSVQNRGIWLWDLQRDQILIRGPRLVQAGFSSEELTLTGQEFIALVDGQDSLRFNRTVRDFVREHTHLNVECRLVGSQTQPWLRFTGAALLRDRKGRLQMAMGVIEDVGAHKVHIATINAMNEENAAIEQQRIDQLVRTKMQLQELVNQQLQLLDTLPLALAWKDNRGVYLGCNKLFASYAGQLRPANVVGKSDWDLSWVAHAAAIAVEDEQVVSGELASVELEKSTVLPDNSEVDLRIKKVPLIDSSDNIVGCLATFEDITQNNKMVRLVEAEGYLLQDVMDNSAAIISVVDRNQVFIRVNRYFARMINKPVSEIIGKPTQEIIPQRLSERVSAICQHIISTGESVSEEYKSKDAHGNNHYFMASVTPMFDANGEVDRIITVSNEITQIKRVQQDLEEARQKAEAAVDIKAQFLANMSHEIRTPMNAILGLSQLALATNLNEKQHDYIDKISYSAKNLLGIINDILDFSKIEAGKFSLDERPFDLRLLVQNLCSIFLMRADKKGLVFSQHMAKEVPIFVCADSLRLHQVLVNLLGNAIKFTTKGKVQLSVQTIAEDEHAHTLRFAVKDTGVGLTEAQMASLFQPFEQADASVSRQFGGTGLGLAICKRLVNLMGGEITVSSEYHKGSEFSFDIDVKRADADQVVAANTALAPMQMPDFCGAKILLVEDNDINRQVASELLQPLNLVVSVAVNGREAVDKVMAEHYDLVLMDIQMPIMDGYTATREIRKIYDKLQLPVLGLTANVMFEDRLDSLSAGLNAHIAKPIDREELLTTLMQFLKVDGVVKDLTEVHSGEANLLPAELPGLTIAARMRALRLSPQRYLTLLHGFVNNYATEGVQIMQLLELGKFDDARALVHRLKGLSGNLGAVAVYKLTCELEVVLAGFDVNVDLELCLTLAKQLIVAVDEVSNSASTIAC